ncbi:MAG: DUF4465 domain-containing protein [Planctomycetota bacterium]|nr:DUF4465 domain-containing protein [Planctomycetota bacterium]
MIGKAFAAMVMVALAAGTAVAEVADFDNLALAPGGYWNGSADPSAGGFTTGPAFFNNFYTVDDFSGWAFWGGWAYSSVTDNTTPGYTNQYSAVTGTGHTADNYGIAFMDTFYGITPTVTFAQPTALVSAQVTNTTYAYYDMLNGSQYSKQFGGAPGEDPDWFLLTITGKDAGAGVTGTVECYLADFRPSESSQDYILDTWTPVDLTALGQVTSLEFTLSSSDTGDWGMNTPAYFTLDTLTVAPEPATLTLAAAGAAALALRRRRA